MVTYVGDVQYEHWISEAFDNTKVIFKELEGFNHKGNVVAILNNEAQNSKLADWFDKVYFEEA